MKWFWYSLIGFCILMCSCRTKKVDSSVQVRSDIRSDLSYLNESVKISSKNNAYFANEMQSIVIEEDITVTEYDKEGNKTKETNAKRKIAQDSDKVSTEEGSQTVTKCNQLKAKHVANVSKKVESEVKEESRSDFGMFWEQFGKYLGIIMGIALIIGIFGRYLLKKMRVS